MLGINHHSTDNANEIILHGLMYEAKQLQPAMNTLVGSLTIREITADRIN